MNFSDMSNEDVRDFAGSVLQVREWMLVTGNRRIEEYGTVSQLWRHAREELSRRGLLAEFEHERGMR